jgi:hypothetical protein
MDTAGSHPLSDLYGLAESGTASLRGDYESPAPRARWASRLLIVAVVADGLSLLALASQRSLLDRGPGAISLAEWHRSQSRIGGLALVELALLILGAIFVLRWLHLAYRNLTAIGAAELRFTPGWAVGWWFVPIANIVRPKQVLDDLWRASAADETGPGWRGLPRPNVTAIWWLTLVLAGVTGRLAVAMSTDTIDHLKTRDGALMFSHATSIVAAICLWQVVRKVTARQDARAAALERAG